MKYARIATALIITFSFVTFGLPMAHAQVVNQQVSGTWNNVKAIQLGEKLEVKLKTGKTEKGTLTNVADTGISLSRGSGTIDIDRDNVRRVHQVVGKSSRKPVIVGAVVGASIVTLGLGLLSGSKGRGFASFENGGIVVAGLIAAGAGTGALVGNLFRKRKTLVLIYESQ